MRWVIALMLVAACDSSEPSEGLFDRLERQEQEKQVAHAKARRRAVEEKIRAEMEQDQMRSGLRVDLPRGPSTDIDVTRASIVIDIPVSGDVVVAGRAVRDQDIDELFLAGFTRDKDVQVVLRADQGVAHGRIVALMERAKAVGITRLAIGTMPRAAPAP